MRAILGGEPRLVEKMEGTEILPVTAARTCEYADGCDEVAMPGSTCCWRHRRAGKLFGVPPPAPPIRERRTETVESNSKMATTCKCGCGETPMAGREFCWGHKGRVNGTAKPAKRSIEVSTAARDALRPNSGTGIPDLSRRKTVDADSEADEKPVFTVKMTEPMLDTFWGLLDGKSKAALLSKMGAD